jgi:hypothetical protein
MGRLSGRWRLRIWDAGSRVSVASTSRSPAADRASVARRCRGHLLPHPSWSWRARAHLPPSGRAITTSGWPTLNWNGRDQIGIGGQLLSGMAKSMVRMANPHLIPDIQFGLPQRGQRFSRPPRSTAPAPLCMNGSRESTRPLAEQQENAPGNWHSIGTQSPSRRRFSTLVGPEAR